MSLALLQQLRAANAFDHYPLFEALGELHVPFDSLVPGARVEARLDEALRRRGRVALVGGSGSGKSSGVSHVLGPMVEGLAPILIRVGVLPSAEVVEPVNVAAYLIKTVAERARQSGLIDDRSAGRARERAAQTESVRMERSLRGSASVGFSWVSAGLGKDLVSQTEAASITITPDERFEVVQQILGRISEEGLEPVLVFDDTDRWIDHLGHENPRLVVESFFGRVVRWVNDLGCAMCVAVHDSYFTPITPRRELLEAFDTTIDIPSIRRADAVATIL